MGVCVFVQERGRFGPLLVDKVGLSDQSPRVLIVLQRHQTLANGDGLFGCRWILPALREIKLRESAESINVLWIDSKRAVVCGNSLISSTELLVCVADVIVVCCIGFHLRRRGGKNRNRLGKLISEYI